MAGFSRFRPWTGALVVTALAMTALGTTVLAGCDGEAKSAASLNYTEDAHAAYKEAMAAFEEKDWEDARALFEEVKRLFNYSRYAKLAELRIADIDFEQGKFSDAISSYRGYVKGHRGDDNVEYAKYRISKALYNDIGDTILLPPAEERDQANAADAHRELKGFVRRFPKSRYLADAAYMLEVVTQRLVRHELYVARYYLREDNFKAAVGRCNYALENYAGSGLDAEALVLKGETLLKMQKDTEAREVFETVVRDYGGAFGIVAKRFLAMMGDAPAAEPGAAPSDAAPDGSAPGGPGGSAPNGKGAPGREAAGKEASSPR
jgi:outer membrane protein assembly factor BamD